MAEKAAPAVDTSAARTHISDRPFLKLEDVAARLRKSERWLQAQLTNDRRLPPSQQRLQDYAYLGRTPLWTEVQYLALESALLHKRKRRANGLAVIDRGGWFHVHGSVVVQGRHVSVRKSIGLKATAENREEAETERLRIEREIRSELKGEPGHGPALSIAAEAYLTRARKRPIGATSVLYIKNAVKQFGLRQLSDISEREWAAWVDLRCKGHKAESRERFINTVLALLNWCARKPRRWGVAPTFDRDKQARSPRHRAKRTVSDLSPALIDHMLGHAAPHLAAQLWVEWSTGARVKSILHHCCLADVILAPGREQITFRGTKNGTDVTAMLHPRAAQAIRDYLPIRGRLHDREGPLFLTQRGKAYSQDSAGVQNKSAFNAMKRRARKALRQSVFAKARDLIKRGKRDQAADLITQLRADHRLLGRITQHWFRHMLATRMRGDIKAAMAQGGWIDERSVMAYTMDAPEHRRQLVAAFDDGAFSGAAAAHKKA